jgi:hypothetical protein
MGRNRYKFTKPNLPHFMTYTFLHWIPVFTRPKTVSILLESLSYLVDSGIKLYAYVILENHMHSHTGAWARDIELIGFPFYSK